MSRVTATGIRFLGWAFVGIMLLALVCYVIGAIEARRLDPDLSKNFPDANSGGLVVAAAVFGLGMLVTRLVVGAFVRASARDADRATARGLLRLGVGFAVGCTFALAVVGLREHHLSPGDVFPGGAGPEGFGMMLGLLGGVSMVLAGAWMRRRTDGENLWKRGARLLAFWLAFYALALAVWFAFDESSRKVARALSRDEPFAYRKPMSDWLEVLSKPDSGKSSDKVQAVYSLGRIGAADGRCARALVAALADEKNEVAEAAAYQLDKFANPGPDVVPALGRALSAPTPKSKYNLYSALSKTSASELLPLAPDVCRALTRPKGSDSSPIFKLLKRVDPSLELPESNFSPGYRERRDVTEKNSALVAKAVHKLGPAAEAAYRDGLRALLTSAEPDDRRFAAYAIGGFGPEARDDAARLTQAAENPVNFIDSDGGPAALALVKIGDTHAAAKAFAAMLARHDYRDDAYYGDDIEPWKELKKLPPDATNGLPPAVKVKLGMK